MFKTLEALTRTYVNQSSRYGWYMHEACHPNNAWTATKASMLYDTQRRERYIRSLLINLHHLKM